MLQGKILFSLFWAGLAENPFLEDATHHLQDEIQILWNRKGELRVSKLNTCIEHLIFWGELTSG